ncbi:MAG: monooxygenase [Devosia sp. 67-54]|uniref:FAD-dependent oxidoreductase n=1 Tax=unclassified Devosia TaxID=196773 RepID=UPI000868C328|nr:MULTISPECIES: FAD-dependent oxidoreductase [unclassified Devosia]MBN9306538.1 FAD-dependent monooxygenase [Devosia sp.]ODU61572.1 MAG: monooxygenase [Acetobacteraceae bacterium SCN 69-10]OJX15826.1 MAG: monooxygenase [Devosia sp. 67-54]
MTADTDIAIVGGGLAGTIAAIALARTGARVTLIDRNAVPPDEFRVEKLGGMQLESLERLGLLDLLAAHSTRFDQSLNIRHGRIVDRTNARYQAAFYADMVKTMRSALPGGVRTVIGRVTELATGAELQQLTIAEHGTLGARLVVLASGMSDLLRARLGITREVLHERQSLTFGFNLRPRDGIAAHPALTVYGERPRDGIDYLTLFPIGGLIRANLFVFLDHRDAWIKALRADPLAALDDRLPGLRHRLDDVELEGRVQNWIMDLAVARNVRQPGVVLIGDAYQTSCPAAGTGVSRLLTDVERLAAHVPAWLATPGMDAARIAAFYDDPVKAAMDAHALGLAGYRRAFTVDTRLSWRARRQAQFLRRRLLNAIDTLSPPLAARIRALRA